MATDRLPDAVAGRQIHVVYAIPADGADRFSGIVAGIASDIAAMDAWWRREDSTRAPRFDLASFLGCASGFSSLDISFSRLTGEASVYESLDGRFGRLTAELSRTYTNPSKKYLVYYDGRVESRNVCGTANLGRVQSGPDFALVYGNAERCGTLGSNNYNVKVAAHELLHTLGAVPPEAPHPCPTNPAHTCDDGFDVMHGLSFGFGGIEQWKLDVGRDDYYGHSGSWLDVQDSPFLRRLDVPQQQLTVSLAGTVGGSSVESGVPGIDCPTICSNTWDGGEPVTLEALPAEDLRVVRWTGGCSGTATTCALTMDRPQTAGVVIGPLSYSGRVSVVGRGRVTNAGLGFSCARSCSERFEADQTFAFRALAAKGWSFQTWQGDCRGRSTCRLRFDRSHTIRAVFRRR